MFSLLFSQPLVFFAWLIAFLLALTVHEFSHALAGSWLGDDTARRMGRLTLNPLAHIDPIGLLAVIFIGFGWGKPVPFNPYNLKWPKWGPVAVAAAGPASNLLLAIIGILVANAVYPVLGPANLLVIFLIGSAQVPGGFVALNVVLMMFNLIPLPPLDGSKALLAVLSHPKYTAMRRWIEMQGPMVLLGLILIDSFANLGIFSFIFSLGFRLISLVTNIPSLL
jgi:Zn-dependent protease